MNTTIDSAGRLVVPKRMREALGIKPGQKLDIDIKEDHLELRVKPTPMHLDNDGRTKFAVPETNLPVLSAELVRKTLEHGRR